MNRVSKFFHNFSYELIGLCILLILSATLIFVNKLSGLIVFAGAIVYGIILVILF